MSPKLNQLTHLIVDMQGLENELHMYERKYHLRSADFYRLANTDQIEQTPEFLMWLGTFQAWQKRKENIMEIPKPQSPKNFDSASSEC